MSHPVRSLSLLVLISLFACGPDLSQFQALRNPRIAEQPNEKMLVIELTGDPGTISGKAIGTLFKYFYKLDSKHRAPRGIAAPRARWPKSPDTVRNEWIGIFALPVADSLSKLPEGAEQAGLRIDTWEYGTVAEILHTGAYSSETPTIQKLHDFIEQSGYRIVGPHEEEYLKGPGMFFQGDPADYQTIIRYRVAKK